MTNQDLLLNALVSRMRMARRNATSFDQMGVDYAESAQMWRDTYDQLEGVLYDLIQAKDDEWVVLIKTLRAEWE